MRYHLDNNFHGVPECNNIGTFCPIFILCKGKKIGRPLRFASNISAYQIQSFCSFSCSLKTIEEFCIGKGTIDMTKIILDKATFLFHSGELSLACILACIACETFLTEHICDKLFIQGLTNSKEKDVLRDLSFSQMLNLLSYFVLDMKDTSIKKNIGQINSIRKLRNEIIHNGKWLSIDSRQNVKDGIEALKEIYTRIKTPPK
jgi:hypothetical protein